MRYFLYIAYMGSAYSGWQIQQNALSVQQVVQASLSKLLATHVRIWGSSRTDRGVHAKQQVAHFDSVQVIDAPQLMYRLNRVLPVDISILAIVPVMEAAHARFDACYRVYEYTLIAHKNPFVRHTAAWMHRFPPLTLLNQAAALFCVKADFKNFSKGPHQLKELVCAVQEVHWRIEDNRMIFRVKSDRFLYGMVRIMVSVLLQVGNGKIPIERLSQWILAKSTVQLRATIVPPHGLTLVEIGYPTGLFLNEEDVP